MRVLLVEDSERLRKALQEGLRRQGFAVDGVDDGQRGLAYAANNPYDVVVLDLMLPKLGGLDVLRTLRERGSDVPVLILSARGHVEERVAGLQAGADDYLAKPFDFSELVERIRALVRRRHGAVDPTLRFGDLALEPAGLFRDGQPVLELTRKEHMLLTLMALKLGGIVSRVEIEDALYDERTLPEGNAVQSLVSRLRAKLADVEGAPLIQTLRGRGYRLVAASP